MRPRVSAGFAAAALLAWAVTGWAADSSSVEERAYAFNREGMIAMSEARFTDAIAAFEQAAALAIDYTIFGQPLMYTPVFMTAWASEKIGRTPQACQAYRRYLRLAVEHPVEPTKVDHAKVYISSNC